MVHWAEEERTEEGYDDDGKKKKKKWQKKKYSSSYLLLKYGLRLKNILCLNRYRFISLSPLFVSSSSSFIRSFVGFLVCLLFCYWYY